MGVPTILKTAEPSLTTQALQRLEQLRVEQDALRQQLAEERRQQAVQVQEAVRANEELRDHIRRIKESTTGQTLEAAQQATSIWQPPSVDQAYIEVEELEQARTSKQDIYRVAEEAQRIASHQSTTRAEDSKELYDRHVGDRLAALNSNRAAQASLQQRIIAAQEELGVLLGARKVRDDKLQAAVDAQTAQENREYAAACLIQRTWRRYKIGHPMPKLELKEPGKKGKKGGKGEKDGRSSPKKGGAKGKGNSSPKKKGEKKASTGKAKGSSSPKAKTKAKAK